MMKLIVITWPHFLEGEGRLLTSLFENGLSVLHLRKPEATEEEVTALLEEIPPQWHDRIVIHDHYALALRYNLKGIHLNRRNISRLHGMVPFSCSCHTLKEVEGMSGEVRGYVFLSPIFDSISKAGYRGAFAPQILQYAHERQIIHERVIALGGITVERVRPLSDLGFGGVAVLGALWENLPEEEPARALLDRFNGLREACDDSQLSH